MCVSLVSLNVLTDGVLYSASTRVSGLPAPESVASELLGLLVAAQVNILPEPEFLARPEFVGLWARSSSASGWRVCMLARVFSQPANLWLGARGPIGS